MNIFSHERNQYMPLYEIMMYYTLSLTFLKVLFRTTATRKFTFFGGISFMHLIYYSLNVFSTNMIVYKLLSSLKENTENLYFWYDKGIKGRQEDLILEF